MEICNDDSICEVLTENLTNEKNYRGFIDYLRTFQDETRKESIIRMIESISKSAVENPLMKKLISDIFKEVILRCTVMDLKIATENDIKCYDGLSKHENFISFKNRIMILDMLIKSDLSIITENFELFRILLESLFIIPIIFQSAGASKFKIYFIFYQILKQVYLEPEKYSEETKLALLSIETANEIMKDFKREVGGVFKNLPNEQKMFLELVMLLKKFDAKCPGISSIYEYPSLIGEIEKTLQVMSEQKQFDLISYMIYYQNDLTRDQLDALEIKIGTLEKLTYHNFVAKVNLNQSDWNILKLGHTSKIDQNELIALTADPEGEKVIKMLSSNGVLNNEYANVNLSHDEFYLHYPYSKGNLIYFGENTNERLGVRGIVSMPSVHPQTSLDFIQLKSRSDFTIGLTSKKELYFAGSKTSIGESRSFMKYPKWLPSSKIVSIEASENNIMLLTEDGNLYIEGKSEDDHFGANEQYTKFLKLKRPNDDKVVGFDVGSNYHLYFTERGELYGMGSVLAKFVGAENTIGRYFEIPLPDGAVPLKVKCSKLSDSNSPVFLLLNNNGKNELWSTGISPYSLLGQGLDKEPELGAGFKKLDYDSEMIEFTDVD